MDEPLSVNDFSKDTKKDESSKCKKKLAIISIIEIILVLIIIIIIVIISIIVPKNDESIDEPVKVGEINCNFKIDDITKEISLLSNKYEEKISSFDIIIGNKKVNSKLYRFSSIGSHDIKIVLYGDIKMDYMFQNIKELYSVEMKSIKNSKITSMISTFESCSNLKSFSMSGFNYEELKSMSKIFYKTDLSVLDFKDLNTKNVKDISYMFAETKLKKINLFQFDTSNVINMSHLFYGLSSLLDIEISKFNTKKVMDMSGMFGSCASLTSLDLSNFDTSLLTSMYDMFEFCTHLEYINMKNFNLTKISNFSNIFNKVPENVVICLNEAKVEKIMPQINNITCHIIDCSDNWKANQKKLMEKEDICIDSCEKTTLFKYEYNGKCYENCTNGYFFNNKTLTNECKCQLEKCLTCPPVALNLNLCTKCNTDYYQKENDTSNYGEYINCYKELEEYYLDINASLYKKCYYTCKTCDIKGNNFLSTPTSTVGSTHTRTGSSSNTANKTTTKTTTTTKPVTTKIPAMNKSYSKKTNNNGEISLKINLAKGDYKVTFSYGGSIQYGASSRTINLKVT